jgi:hypothetical protein
LDFPSAVIAAITVFIRGNQAKNVTRIRQEKAAIGVPGKSGFPLPNGTQIPGI